MHRHTLLGSAALTVVALAATGCTVLTGARPAAAASVVSVGITEPSRLLPADLRDPDGAQVIGALFSPLVEVAADGRVTPVAAESVTSPDGRVWTVRLRAGFTFHDGEPVTADHYLAAWNYAAYGPNRQAGAYLFSSVQGFAGLQARGAARALRGLARVDERTFTVTLLQPSGDFPALLANPAFHPLPSSAWQVPGVLRASFEDAPVGNGPFRMRGSRHRGSRIEVERYDAFVGTRPQVTGVEFRIYPQLGKAYADVVGGRLDVVTAIPPHRLAAADTELAGRVHRAAGAVVQFLAFPPNGRTFSDTRVRRAISMAIDRDALVRSVFGAGQEPARSFVPPVVPGHRPDGCGAGCRYDPAAARQLYQAAGGPARLDVAYNADGDHRGWVDVLCGQLTANLGVGCAGVAEPTFADLLAGVRQGRLGGLYRMAWELDYPSMENYLGPLFTSTGAANYAGFRNPVFDEAVRTAASARSAPEIITGYQRAEDLLAADMPAIPVRFSRTNVGYSAAVRNVVADRWSRIDLVAVTKGG